MNLKLVTGLLIFVITGFTVSSQSIYFLEYNFHSAADTNSYEAFLIRNNDGSGLMRVKYKYPMPGSGQGLLAIMDVEEVNILDSSGNEYPGRSLLKPGNVKFKTETQSPFTPPFIIQKPDEQSGFVEPSGVCASESNPVMLQGTTFSPPQFAEYAALTKGAVSRFFKTGDKEDEDFLNNFFKTTRGGMTLTSVEKKYKMHLIIVADTMDAKIGKSVILDMNRAEKTFDSLRGYMGIKFAAPPVKIYGKNYSKKTVDEAIARLKPLPDDIVIFYYAGHGFNIPETTRRFPNLKLKNFRNERKNFKDSLSWIAKDRQDNITYSLNIEDIYNSITAKGARFNLVISDCCNDDIFGTNETIGKQPKKRGSDAPWSDDNIKALFLSRSHTSILATGTSVKQLASGNSTDGGIFSYCFKSNLDTYLSKAKKNVSWNQLLEEAKKQTSIKRNQKQNPDFKIDIPAKR